MHSRFGYYYWSFRAASSWDLTELIYRSAAYLRSWLGGETPSKQECTVSQDSMVEESQGLHLGNRRIYRAIFPRFSFFFEFWWEFNSLSYFFFSFGLELLNFYNFSLRNCVDAILLRGESVRTLVLRLPLILNYNVCYNLILDLIN